MKLMPNSIYMDRLSQKKYRVLYVDIMSDMAVVIDMDNRNQLPLCVSYQVIENRIEDKSYTEEIENEEITNHVLTVRQKENMEYQWNSIKDFVNTIPDCYNKKIRSQFIKSKSDELGCTRMQIQRTLHKFWACGMTKDALIPKYRTRGGKKGERVYTKKPGRPVVRDNSNKRLIIGKDELNNIKRAIDSFYNRDSRYSLNTSYKEMLRLYYTDRDTNELVDAYPTFGQFMYHSKKYLDERKHIGEKRFDRNLRGLIGSSKSEADGPGEAYQIDATIADIYIVSRENRKQVVGRPVLYFVVDIFSRLIVGFYVGIEGPSWIGAMMALYYTFISKVEVCEKYGVHIKEEEWPAKGLPQSIICDNGEMISKNSENIINGLNIQVKNTVSWRPDMKGIIEQRFHLLNLDTKLYTPGSVYPDYKDRGARDYRQDAVLNIDEFTIIIINYILMYNRKSLTQMPHETIDIIEDNVKPVPIELWNWGIKNRSGSLRKMSNEKIKQSLLPSNKATVTAKGIHFNGKYYNTKKMITENWTAKARSSGSWKIDIKYDPRDTKSILVLYDNGLYEWANQSNGSDEEFYGWYYEELLTYREQRKNESSEMKEKNIQLEIDYHNSIEQIIKEAKKDVDKFKKNNVKDIREAKNLEKYAVRNDEKFSPTTGKITELKSSEKKMKNSSNRSSKSSKGSKEVTYHDDSMYFNVNDLDDGEDW